MNKIRVYHFHNGKGGGVLSVIKNLLRFSNNPMIENHIIYTINKEQTPVFTIEHIAGAVTEQIFYYSPKWNFYYTSRQLARLLPDSDTLIIAHDWLELGMMSNLGLQNPTSFFLHGDYDYYFQLAIKHENSIDFFIPVAQNIELKLQSLLLHRINEISYLRFPVPAIPYLGHNKDNDIIFIGRLEDAKGYTLLPAIAKKIQEKNIDLQWHIVGGTNNSISDTTKWDKNIRVIFYGNISNAEVIRLLPYNKILILPSLAEGMPVVLIEAMKAGVIPIVNDIEGGIQELVFNNKTGYKINGNEINKYVETISMLIENKNITAVLQDNCRALANTLFDPIENTLKIENKLVDMFSAKRKNKPTFKVYGSRLDKPWIPNYVVYMIRKLKFY